MPRDLKIALGILAVAVLVGLISLRGLHQRMQGLAESQSTEEKARREVLAPEINTPSDVQQGAKIYWPREKTASPAPPWNLLSPLTR